MKIPLIDLKAQYATIRDEVREVVDRVLERQHFIGGDEVAGFEEEFAAWLGVEGAVGVASGTAAVHLALRACGVGPGDEVITVAHTFAATAEAIVHAGGAPVFVDVDPDTGCMDPARAAEAITERTKVLLPVALYGHPAPMGPLREIASAHGLRVVEDAAQAHGASLDGRRCGGLGDLSCFSFYPGKNLGAYGDAGGVTGNDRELLHQVRLLRDHGRTSKYEHRIVGWGERLDALQAAVLRVKLRHLEAWTTARRAAAARYGRLLAGMNLVLPVERPDARHVYHLYVVRSDARDALLAGLKERGVGAGVHYPIPLHRQPAFADVRVPAAGLPISERLASEVLSLPLYPELTDEAAAYVASALGELI